MRRLDDHDAPPPPTGAAVVRADRASRRARLSAVDPALIWQRPAGAQPAAGKLPSRGPRADQAPPRPGPDGELVDVDERQRKPRPWEGVAMARLGELRTLVAFQTSRGFRLTEPEPVLYVIANALYALTEFEPYRLNASWLRRFLPPGCHVQQAVLDEVMSTASRAWLSADDAGRRVGLDLATHEALSEQGVLLARLNPFDETEEQRTARRKKRKAQKAAARWQAFKARRDAQRNATSPATPHSSSLERCTPHVALAVVAAINGGATTVAEIAVAMDREPQKVRREVERAAKSGLIVRTGRGRYAPIGNATHPDCAEGGPPPLALEEAS